MEDVQKHARLFRDAVNSMLVSMSHARCIKNVEFSQSDEKVYTVSWGDIGMGVDVGVQVPLKSILGDRTAPGFRVWTIKYHPGGRWNPPEEEDVTVCETLQVHTALCAIGNSIVSNMASCAMQQILPNPEETEVEF